MSTVLVHSTTPIRLSNRAWVQAACQGVPIEHIRLALECGTQDRQEAGVTLYHLGRHGLPRRSRPTRWGRVDGLIVIQAADGTIVGLQKIPHRRRPASCADVALAS